MVRDICNDANKHMLYFKCTLLLLRVNYMNNQSLALLFYSYLRLNITVVNLLRKKHHNKFANSRNYVMVNAFKFVFSPA